MIGGFCHLVSGRAYTFLVPLHFWFCRNPGLALPLIALQYHEVKVQLTIGHIGSSTTIPVKLYVDYIYLDTDERRRFAQVSHEYLIEQIQKQSIQTTEKSQKLIFNHPVKELIWTSSGTASYNTAQLKLNGHDRFSMQENEYFQLRQPFDYHTAIPRQNLPSAAQLTNNMLTAGVANVNVLLNDDKNIVVTATNEVGPNTDAAGSFSILVTSERDTVITPGSALASNGDGSTPADTTSDAAVPNPTKAQWETGFDGGATDGKSAFYMQEAVGAHWAVTEGRLVRLAGTNFNLAAGGTALSVDVTVVRVVTAANGTATAGAINTGTLLYLDRNIIANLNASDATHDTTITSVQVFNPSSAVVNEARTSKLTSMINVYSFALKPEEHQPSGTCNFSRIDTAILEFGHITDAFGSTDSIYAVNYNVLRIMSGMGGLAYSN